jgi:ABC-2 type transport system ATP-binding protein
MIEVRGFAKAYGERIAVRDLCFSVRAGEIVGLLGPNGAGKTTTLRSLAGILRPSAGSLAIGGFDVVRDPLEAKRRLALVADDPPLFASLSVWEHLVLFAQLYDLTGWEERAAALLAELELLARRDDLAEELSRGMRQKLCVACSTSRGCCCSTSRSRGSTRAASGRSMRRCAAARPRARRWW